MACSSQDLCFNMYIMKKNILLLGGKASIISVTHIRHYCIPLIQISRQFDMNTPGDFISGKPPNSKYHLTVPLARP